MGLLEHSSSFPLSQHHLTSPRCSGRCWQAQWDVRAARGAVPGPNRWHGQGQRGRARAGQGAWAQDSLFFFLARVHHFGTLPWGHLAWSAGLLCPKCLPQARASSSLSHRSPCSPDASSRLLGSTPGAVVFCHAPACSQFLTAVETGEGKGVF